MAWDARRGRGVLFGGGGYVGNPLDGGGRMGWYTWEWDGSDWVRLAPQPEPSVRAFTALAFDAARGEVVLFGGRNDAVVRDHYFGDTWVWDGQRWAQRAPEAGPRPRGQHAMGYHEGTERVVLFGGATGVDLAPLGDTWEWDGERWLERHPLRSPPARRSGRLAWDPERRTLVLVGGSGAHAGACGSADMAECVDAWEWDGDRWKPRHPEVPPLVRPEGLWHDGDGLLEAGPANLDGRETGAVYGREGSSWFRVDPPPIPPRRALTALATDPGRGRTVLFGGVVEDTGSCGLADSLLCPDTWEWDGRRWARATPDASPPPRAGGALAFDPARGVVVLFGGCSHLDSPLTNRTCGGPLGDTWTWDGVTWRPVGDGPPARGRATLAWDETRQVLVLFGGRVQADGRCDPAGDTPLCGDTWAWDGASWQRQEPAEAPRPRSGHAAATDPATGHAFLHGGLGARDEVLSDTWRCDEETWTRLDPPVSPPALNGHALATSASGVNALLIGGESGGVPQQGAWSWDGATWGRRQAVQLPPARNDHGLAPDPTGGWVLAGGHSRIGFFGCRQLEAAGLRTPLCLHTWRLAPQQEVPLLVAAFDLGRGRILTPSPEDRETRTVLGVGVRVRGAGLGGAPDGAPVPGWRAAVGALGHGGWLPLRTSEAPVAEPEAWQAHYDYRWRPEEARFASASVDRWITADDRLLVALSSRAPQGPSQAPAEVALDYVEVRLHYWRTGCEPAQAGVLESGTPDGTPCSDGRPETAGETCVAGRCEAP